MLKYFHCLSVVMLEDKFARKSRCVYFNRSYIFLPITFCNIGFEFQIQLSHSFHNQISNFKSCFFSSFFFPSKSSWKTQDNMYFSSLTFLYHFHFYLLILSIIPTFFISFFSFLYLFLSFVHFLVFFFLSLIYYRKPLSIECTSLEFVRAHLLLDCYWTSLRSLPVCLLVLPSNRCFATILPSFILIR